MNNCSGTIGFGGMSSLLYQVHRRTMVKEILSETIVAPKIAIEKGMKARLVDYSTHTILLN